MNLARKAATLLIIAIVGGALLSWFCLFDDVASLRNAESAADHRVSIAEWQARRLKSLTSETGWLTVVGLHWLKEGANPFGSAPENPVRLPVSVTPRAGTIFLENGKARAVIDPASGISVNGQQVAQVELRSDAYEEPTMLKAGTVQFYLIKRGERLGVRVKDSASETRKGFRGIDMYPVDQRWRFEASFVPYVPPKRIPIQNIIGTVEDMPSPGQIRFKYQGREYSLDAIDDGSDDLFVIFSDLTSGRETYGAGRYMYIARPKNGKVILDFNKAYNPPCAFTDYATCPLPPRQNKLPVAVTAGEKKYSLH